MTINNENLVLNSILLNKCKDNDLYSFLQIYIKIISNGIFEIKTE